MNSSHLSEEQSDGSVGQIAEYIVLKRIMCPHLALSLEKQLFDRFSSLLEKTKFAPLKTLGKQKVCLSSISSLPYGTTSLKSSDLHVTMVRSGKKRGFSL